jgi:hypothetical protein
MKGKCMNCGKEHEVPDGVGEGLIVCNPACYDAYIVKVKDSIFEVEFCKKTGWLCLQPDEQAVSNYLAINCVDNIKEAPK